MELCCYTIHKLKSGNYLRTIPNVITNEGYGQIIFRSMDAPQRIVGYQVADSFVDELDTMKLDDAAYAWRQIVARCRHIK